MNSGSFFFFFLHNLCSVATARALMFSIQFKITDNKHDAIHEFVLYCILNWKHFLSLTRMFCQSLNNLHKWH